jgi:hypothetical protein
VGCSQIQLLSSSRLTHLVTRLFTSQELVVYTLIQLQILVSTPTMEGEVGGKCIAGLPAEVLSSVFEYLDYDALLQVQQTSTHKAWQVAANRVDDRVYERTMRARQWMQLERERKDAGFRQGVLQANEDEQALQRGFNSGFLSVVHDMQRTARLQGYTAAAAMFATENRGGVLSADDQTRLHAVHMQARALHPELPVPIKVEVSTSSSSTVELEPTASLQDLCHTAASVLGVIPMPVE